MHSLLDKKDFFVYLFENLFMTVDISTLSIYVCAYVCILIPANWMVEIFC